MFLDINGKKFEVTKVAGRGEIGHVNYGATIARDEETILKEYSILKEHLGEPVLLTGGGGYTMSIGILEDVKIINLQGGEKALKVRLEDIKPPVFGDEKVFEPWIDSWQISVFDKPDKVREELKKLS